MNSAKYVDEQIELLKGKDIPMSEKCWQTALLCVGWAYVFGAWGALCTTSERKQRYKYNNIASILEKCQCLRSDDPKSSCTGCKWYPNKERTRCFDCRGFCDWILKQFDFDLKGEGATSQWNTEANWCVKSDDMSAIPQGVLVNVFIYDKTKKNMKHTGLYYNGDTAECSNNVQITSPMKKNRWTHWAVAKCFESEYRNNAENAPIQPPADESGATDKIVLKKGDKGEKVREMQEKLLALGYKLPRYGADGSYGNETKSAVEQFQRDWGIPVTGIMNEETYERLMSVKPIYYTVTISRLTAEKADEIIEKYGGIKVAER